MRGGSTILKYNKLIKNNIPSSGAGIVRLNAATINFALYKQLSISKKARLI
ncbi:hypothetical protein PCIT_a1205 [Pseudoalteromonas citrea]|uniref:Uncharacterized protein n=1 Tax=Pseudoalteromonas citrea TaxID=43655 RepID=A0AAD4ALU5_9GAMM|nr:hypothetical protein PCIT_a1205 [Pseudoalteromonas citrea]